MAGRRIAIIGALAQLLGASAASISNCGGPGDIFQVSELAVSPDPVSKREPFTITVTGKLSEAFGGGTIDNDMDVKVTLFGKTIETNTQKTTLMELEPAVPAGDVKFIMGPTEFPAVPGELSLTSRVAIVNEAGKPVACVALDMTTPLGSEVAQLDKPGEPEEAPPTSCRKPRDHLTDASTTKTADGWDQVTLTFDEAITRSKIEVDLKLFAGRIPLTVKMNVPILMEPGIPEGETKIRTKPAPSVQAAPAVAPPPQIRLIGDIVVVDGKNEEITCVHIDHEPEGGAAQEQTVVV